MSRYHTRETIVFLATILFIFFLLNGSHLVALTRPKQGQNCPVVNFPPCIPAFTPFMAHPNISLHFRVTGRRVKIFRFSPISVAAPKKFWWPIASSISMPPTVHIASFEPLYPKVFRGSLKVDMVFGIQLIPKSGNPDLCPPKQAVFH